MLIRIRSMLRGLHRWLGLASGLWLAVAGLTGCLLAYNWELERVFAPHLFAQPQPGPRLDLATLAERAQVQLPRGRVVRVCHTDPRQVQVDVEPLTNPSTGKPFDLGFTEFFTDPWTGQELGRRRRGDLGEGLQNVMPIVYEVHWRLFVDRWGQWLMGGAALTWSLNCILGFLLTLPVAWRGALGRWWLAWKVRADAGPRRLAFDLHRATGLWLWPMLFVFAWSSVMMNLRPVHEAVISRLLDYRSPDADYAPNPAGPKLTPRLTWTEALAQGEVLMAQESQRGGFTAGQPLALMYLADNGFYEYEVRGSRDLFTRAPKGGGTSVAFNGDTGALHHLSQPTGEHPGNTVESWLYALHMARVGGRPYQVFVCLLGLAVAALSFTGVYVWWKKQKGGSWWRPGGPEAQWSPGVPPAAQRRG